MREEAIYELEDAKDGYAEYLSIGAINMAIEALKQPEIIYCKDCANNPKFGIWFKCPMGNLTDLQRNDVYCSFAERRINND